MYPNLTLNHRPYSWPQLSSTNTSRPCLLSIIRSHQTLLIIIYAGLIVTETDMKMIEQAFFNIPRPIFYLYSGCQFWRFHYFPSDWQPFRKYANQADKFIYSNTIYLKLKSAYYYLQFEPICKNLS